MEGGSATAAGTRQEVCESGGPYPMASRAQPPLETIFGQVHYGSGYGLTPSASASVDLTEGYTTVTFLMKQQPMTFLLQQDTESVASWNRSRIGVNMNCHCSADIVAIRNKSADDRRNRRIARCSKTAPFVSGIEARNGCLNGKV